MKIDKNAQQKTALQYKQTMYRDVMTKLNELQNAFLSFTSSTNLLSNAFYNTMTTTVTPPGNLSAAFSVSGSSSAQPGTVSMDYIKQLATARTSKTNFDATGKVSGQMNQDAASALAAESDARTVMVIKVGDKSVEIADVAAEFGGLPPSEVADKINAALAGAGVAAEARFVNNKLQIKADNSEDYITISSKNPDNALATKMFGLVELSGQGSINASVDTEAYLPSFTVNLDGRQQTIRLDLNQLRAFAHASTPAAADAAKDALVTDINDQLQRYFGSGVKADIGADGSIEFESGGKSQKFTVTGNLNVMNVLGMKSGISNKLSTTMSLSDLNFGTELQGNQHTFQINGVEFSYTSDTSLSTVMNDINNSNAGVKVSYLEGEDRFVIQSSETGAGSKELEITQSEGNLMTVLFGADASGVSEGKAITMDMVSEDVNAASIRDGGAFTFNINGRDVKFTISRDKDEAPFTMETFAEEMNKAFKNTFGTLADGQQALQFTTDGDKFTIRANDNKTVVKAVAVNTTTNTDSLGFTTRQSNVASDGATTTLADAGIHFGAGSGITINVGAGSVPINIAASELTDDMTLDELATLINDKIAALAPPQVGSDGNPPKVSFDKSTGAFRVMGVDIPMEILVTNNDSDPANDASVNLNKIFGQSSIAINKDFDVAAYNTAHAGEAGVPIVNDGPTGPGADLLNEIDAGQNAVFSINGSEMERSSNTFTVEGLTYTLHDTTRVLDASGVPTGAYQPATKITVNRDTDKIVEGIQEYLKLYNETIDYINGLYKADATYKNYPPLTAAQKADMSDNEIELWEEKAKEGLLRNDPLLDRVLSGLRKAMYTRPEGSSNAIYDFGITTSFYSNDGNFNAESIDNLRAAIEADPEGLRQLFAGEGGIMELVNTAITDATKSSFASPGYLAKTAGSNMLDTSSSIYKQIEELDDQALTLESRYQNEYSRYWKQFNAMEQMIQQMNQQSSWLSQQFAS